MPAFRWPDARGWIGVGCYSLVIIILVLIAADKKLLESDAFLILATAIVITGWNGGPVGWAYQATKGGGEQAESSARIAEKVAGVSPPPPADAVQAARQTAAAANEEADAIEGART
jgi:hypothetical protein